MKPRLLSPSFLGKPSGHPSPSEAGRPGRARSPGRCTGPSDKALASRPPHLTRGPLGLLHLQSPARPSLRDPTASGVCTCDGGQCAAGGGPCLPSPPPSPPHPALDSRPSSQLPTRVLPLLVLPASPGPGRRPRDRGSPGASSSAGLFKSALSGNVF